MNENTNVNVNVKKDKDVEDMAMEYVIYMGMIMSYKEYKELKEVERGV